MTAITATAAPATVSARRVRVTAVAVAAAANSVLYVAGRLAGVDFKLTDPGSTEAHQLILPEIVVFSALFALLGWGTLALLERFTGHAKAIWTAVAATVLVLSCVPIWIEQATSETRFMLVVIHIAVAAALYPILRTSKS